MAMNALLQQMVTDTIVLTGRPDLEDTTKLAVKAATLKLHKSNYFYPDLKESGVSFDSELFQQQLSIKEVIPQYRSMSYIRKVVVDFGSPTGYVGGEFLERVDPLDTTDSYNVNRENVWYQAGSAIQIRSSTAEKQFLLGCYVDPVLTDETYESWIARDMPFAIMYDAAATVFKGIGFDEQAAMYRQDTATWQLELVRNYIKPDAF